MDTIGALIAVGIVVAAVLAVKIAIYFEGPWD